MTATPSITPFNSKEDCIRAFTLAGYPLIPLNGKRPVEVEWEHTPVGRHKLETLAGGNYGVVLGPRDLVIDVDPRNYEPKDDKPLQRLIQAIGGLSADALVVRTGAGGMHIYLRKPADVQVRNTLSTYKGIEFKGGPGRQVVGPGSIHPETRNQYVVFRGDPRVAVDAPAALLNLVKRLPVPVAVGTDEYKDDDATRDRCISYLGTLPPAVEGFHGDEATFKAAAGLRDRGVSPQLALDLLLHHYDPRCVPSWGAEALHEKVANAYKYAAQPLGNAHPAAAFAPVHEDRKSEADEIDREIGRSGWKLNRKGEPVKCFQNLLNYFTLSAVGLRGCFAYDEFARCVVVSKKTPWGSMVGKAVEDIDLQRMRAHLARQHGYDAGKDDLVDALVDVSQARRFHPVRDYLNALQWDGIPRLDEWLIRFCGAVDDEKGYTRAVGRKTLVAAVARVFEPGIKFDHVLVLEGRQGLGKSGVCKVLGGEWFSDFKMSAGEKDTVQMMQGKWIVEMAELHATRQTDLDTVKAFLTRGVDEARFAYGRLPGKYPRQGIFIATYNPGPDGTYLKDDENRRWWPVECRSVPPGARTFDFPGLKSVRDQLWAEAVTLYRKGESLTMDTDTLAVAARDAQAQRHAESPWKERVVEWLAERDRNPETHIEFLTGRDLYVQAMQGADSRYTRHHALEAAKTLRELGWEPGHMRKDGILLRGYWRPNAKKRQPPREMGLDALGDLV